MSYHRQLIVILFMAGCRHYHPDAYPPASLMFLAALPPPMSYVLSLLLHSLSTPRLNLAYYHRLIFIFTGGQSSSLIFAIVVLLLTYLEEFLIHDLRGLMILKNK